MGKDMLTNREMDVVFAVLDGHTKLTDIATHLGISYGTVRTYMNHIHDYYDVHSRAELVTKLKREEFDRLLTLLSRAVVALEKIVELSADNK